MYRPLLLLLTLLPAALLASGPAAAADLGNKGTRFGLEMYRLTAPLQYDQGSYDTHFEGFLVFFTEPVGESVDIGMDIGRIFLSQKGNPDSAGASMGGMLFGFWAQYNFMASDSFGLHARGSYRYHQAGDRSDPDREVYFEWQELDARLLASLRFGRVELVAGGMYQQLAGTHSNEGLSNASWSFSSDPGMDLQLQLNLLVDHGGRVGVRVEQNSGDSSHRRLSLVFETRY